MEAVKKGQSVKNIEINFGVEKTFVYNLINRYKETNSVEPSANKGGRKPKLTEEQLEKIAKKIKENCDITLEKLKDELNLPVCISALSRTINNKLQFVYKKKRYMQASEIDRT